MRLNKRLIHIFVIMLSSIFLLEGCTNKIEVPSQEELYEKCASGVVLIYCEYYYKITLPNGNVCYTCGINHDNKKLINLVYDENEVKQQPQQVTGTGFFIDKNGLIMTNRHVADPSADINDLRQILFNILTQTRNEILQNLQYTIKDCYEYKNSASALFKYILNKNSYNNDINSYVAQYNQYKEMYDFIGEISNQSEIKIKLYSKLGIVYNNTNIDDFDDFLNNPCVLRKSSKYEPADLAIIQLKSQQTPEKAHIFDISGKVYKPKESYTLFESLLKIVFGNEPMECIENEKVNIGQQLYMIGYNSGFNIALTKEGIKSQITSGKLTQESDGERLLYDVKSMQGASGSPVIDEYGNLRAVNYAKFGLENNFNIGVSMNLIEKFLAE